MDEIELHRLDLRYERLRTRQPAREQRLLASLARQGQQTPVLVVQDAAGVIVLVDGYKRVRALRRLHHDTVTAARWDLDEAQALLVERVMRRADGDGPLEQGLLLRELRDRFGLGVEELGRRFDKSPSWVSRRLGLVSALPEEIQRHVHEGAVAAYAATKFLVPLARANRDGCVRLCAALAPLRPTTRQVGALCSAYASGSDETRALLLTDPKLFLRAHDEAARGDTREQTPAQRLTANLGALAGTARRLTKRLRGGLVQSLSTTEREESCRLAAQVRADVLALFQRWDEEVGHAGRVHAQRDPSAP